MSVELSELRWLLLEVKAGLTRLEDLEAIRSLIVSYARGCDRGNDPTIIGPLFTESGTWECKGFGRYEGRDKVARGLKGIAGEKIWWSLHYMISPQIDLGSDGATARAFWYLWEAATIPHEETGEPEPHWIGATYDADVVKIGGRWLFQRMELILHMASSYQEGWVRKRFPHGTRKQPYFVNLAPGTYHWCACGRSKNQPYCDGSHQGTRFTPVELRIDSEQRVVLCGCKYSKTKPLCDGSHLNLKLD
jgi:CDGSH-type Zn-finger protein